MVLIFNSTVSREISGTNFTRTRAITYTHIYIYVCVWRYVCHNWRASEASETLSGVYQFELMRYVYIYIYIYIARCQVVVKFYRDLYFWI